MWYIDEKYKSHEVREIGSLHEMGSVYCLHQSDANFLVRNNHNNRKDNIMAVVEPSSHLDCFGHVS